MENTEQNTPAPQASAGHMQAEQSRRKKKSGKPVLIVLVILLVLGLLGGGVWYLLREPEIEVDTSTSNSLSTPAVARSTSTPTLTPTPVEIDREEISIEVLNGTGIAGEASFLQTELEDLGYEQIEVGNASSQDNETTIVVFSSETPEGVEDEVTAKLKELYDKVDTDTSSSQTVNISITTGLRSGQTLPTNTPKSATPTPTEAEDLTPTPTN